MHTWAKLCHLAMRKAVKARMAKFSNLGEEETQSKQEHRTHGWVQTSHTRSVMLESAELMRNEQTTETERGRTREGSCVLASVVVGHG